MKAIKPRMPAEFEGYRHVTYAENQPEYSPLPGVMLDGAEGILVTCWKLSFWERIKVLLFGKIFLSIITFGRKLQPIFLSTKVVKIDLDGVKKTAEERIPAPRNRLETIMRRRNTIV